MVCRWVGWWDGWGGWGGLGELGRIGRAGWVGWVGGMRGVGQSGGVRQWEGRLVGTGMRWDRMGEVVLRIDRVGCLLTGRHR